MGALNTLIKQQKQLLISGASQRSEAAKITEPINRKKWAEYSERVRPLEEAASKVGAKTPTSVKGCN